MSVAAFRCFDHTLHSFGVDRSFFDGTVPSSNPGYDVGVSIGEGGFAEVFRARDLRTGQSLAVKRATVADAGLRHEAALLQQLDHPHICRLLAASCAPLGFELVLEFLSGGDLEDVLRISGPCSEPMTSMLLRQVASGLVHAHARGIAHRDLKPANLIFADSARNIIKIADWGLGGSFRPPQLLRTVVGTSEYMALEVMEMDPDFRRMLDLSSTGAGYSASCDSWSLGVIAFEMLLARMPFDDLLSARRYDVQFREQDLSSTAIDFIRRLLVDVPRRLPDEAIIAHGFLALFVKASSLEGARRGTVINDAPSQKCDSILGGAGYIGHLN